jgi:hypothetical protein
MSVSVHGTNGITFNDGSTQNTRAPSAFKNRLINGDMRIDQRSSGAAFSVGTGAVYGSCDRWGSLAGANGVWTQRRTATTLTDFPFGMRIQRTAGSTSTTACYIGQVIETTNCADLAGQSVTLSFDAIAGANFSAASSIVTVELWSGTGTDQGWGSLNAATWSSQSGILNVSQSITTTKTRYSFTAAVPSGVNELAVRLYAVGTGTAGASDFFEITGVQLEAGSTATGFERRPIGTELALCQRYYSRHGGTASAGNYVSICNGYMYSALQWESLYAFPVEMRVAPSFSTSSLSNLVLRNTLAVPTSILSYLPSTRSTLLYTANPSSGSPGYSQGLFVNSGTTGFIEFSAEL